MPPSSSSSSFTFVSAEDVGDAGAATVHVHARGDPAATTALLFFHGLGGHGATRQVEAFADRALAAAGRPVRWYAWDMPHHGRSSRLRRRVDRDAPPHPLRPLKLRSGEALVADAWGFVRRATRADDAGVVLIGQSLGGALALHLASRWPNGGGEGLPPLRGVLAVSPALPNRVARLPTQLSWLVSMWRLHAMLRALPRGVLREARLDPLIATSGVSLPVVVGAAKHVLRGTSYETIACPVTVALGTRDRLLAVRDAARLVERGDADGARGGWTLRVVPNGSHDLLWTHAALLGRLLWRQTSSAPPLASAAAAVASSPATRS
jgi:pimeloyl-ACP methyl ester carboxylesterase